MCPHCEYVNEVLNLIPKCLIICWSQGGLAGADISSVGYESVLLYRNRQLSNFPTKTDFSGAKCCWCKMSEHCLREVEIVMVSLNEVILPQVAHCVVFSARSAREGITVMMKENI